MISLTVLDANAYVACPRGLNTFPIELESTLPEGKHHPLRYLAGVEDIFKRCIKYLEALCLPEKPPLEMRDVDLTLCLLSGKVDLIHKCQIHQETESKKCDEEGADKRELVFKLGQELIRNGNNVEVTPYTYLARAAAQDKNWNRYETILKKMPEGNCKKELQVEIYLQKEDAVEAENVAYTMSGLAKDRALNEIARFYLKGSSVENIEAALKIMSSIDDCLVLWDLYQKLFNIHLDQYKLEAAKKYMDEFAKITQEKRDEVYGSFDHAMADNYGMLISTGVNSLPKTRESFEFLEECFKSISDDHVRLHRDSQSNIETLHNQISENHSEL